MSVWCRFSRMRYAAMILLGSVNVEYHITPLRIDAALAVLAKAACMLHFGSDLSSFGQEPTKQTKTKQTCRCAIM